MALHSLKEQLAAVPRYRPPSSPPRVPSLPTKRPLATSKLLAALDSEIPLLNVDMRKPVCESLAGPSLAFNITASKPTRPFSLNTGINEPYNSISTGLAKRKPRYRRKVEETESALPRYSYRDFQPEPARVYTRHEDEANELVAALKGPLGFDLEWRVFFRTNSPPRRAALVQLCDHKMILLIQVSSMKRFPAKLKEIIESPEIVKTGANILNDGRKLFTDFGICARNLVELGGLARQADTTDPPTRNVVSLAKITERYAHRTLHKGPERTSNWEAVPLTDTQLEYAANDAHCALIVYDALQAMARAARVELDASLYTDAAGAPVAKPAVADLPPPMQSTSSTTSDEAPGGLPANAIRQTPQHLRAYKLWHQEDMPLDQLCATLRSAENPLKESTVISYVVRALQADNTLPFSYDRLVALIQMESGSWTRHHEWVVQQSAEKA